MRIHKEGYKILGYSFIFILLLNILIFLFCKKVLYLQWVIFTLSILFYAFLLYFFRLPKRQFDPVAGLVYSPADGKVVVIEEAVEKEYFKDRRLQVSIFMSPLNVHSNRYPVSGKIKYVKYHPGKYMVAWHPKSSELNERSTIVIETADGKEILIRQIAGAVARRIVTYSKENQNVTQGDELGFIKFGSRVDIFLPLGTKVEASVLQRVRANKDIIAEI
jgi:phosphatidylserine decarboxylase